MRIPQVCYTAVGLFLLSIFASYLTLYRPSSPQPAAFGHLQTLIGLVDLWPSRISDAEDGTVGQDSTSKTTDTTRLFWGDKGANADGARHAGTAYAPLPEIVMTVLYR